MGKFIKPLLAKLAAEYYSSLKFKSPPLPVKNFTIFYYATAFIRKDNKLLHIKRTQHFNFSLQRKGTPVSRREGNQFWRGFTPAATSSFSPALLSHCSLSLTLFFCLTCQAEKNSFAARKGTICRSGQRITIPVKICPFEKRSQLPLKAEAIKGLRIPNQNAENLLRAGNPLQTITF